MSKNVLENLHKDFCIVDRKALKALHDELVKIRKWQERALKIIRHLKKLIKGLRCKITAKKTKNGKTKK